MSRSGRLVPPFMPHVRTAMGSLQLDTLIRVSLERCWFLTTKQATLKRYAEAESKPTG